MARGNFPDKIRPGPEAAADLWGNHPHFVFRDVHELEQGAPDAVRPRQDARDREKAFLALVLRDDAAGLDGMTAAPMHPERLFNHMVGLGKRLVDVAGETVSCIQQHCRARSHAPAARPYPRLARYRPREPSLRSRLAPAARRPRRSAGRSQR